MMRRIFELVKSRLDKKIQTFQDSCAKQQLKIFWYKFLLAKKWALKLQGKVWRSKSEFKFMGRKAHPGQNCQNDDAIVKDSDYPIAKTQAIPLFEISEKIGSDIVRLGNWISKTTQINWRCCNLNSDSFFIGSAPFRQWFQNETLGSELLLKWSVRSTVTLGSSLIFLFLEFNSFWVQSFEKKFYRILKNF